MKKLISLVLVLVIIGTTCVVPVSASSGNVTSQATIAADILYDLGLFSGTGVNADGTPIYSLEKEPTRAQAITMLVNLLGKADEAKSGSWQTPFTDVPAWAQPFVGYAYVNGLTSGISATKFGTDNPASAAMYLTFVLKALGYTAGADFVWTDAAQFADELGITSGEYLSGNKINRGDVVMISESALVQQIKGTKYTLIDRLEEDGAVGVDVATQYKSRTVDARGIKLSSYKVGVEVGKSFTIKADVLPEAATDKTVVWTSSNEKIATVKNGIVYGVAEGNAVITARAASGASSSCVASIVPSDELFSYSGTGDVEIENISLPKGNIYIEYEFETSYDPLSWNQTRVEFWFDDCFNYAENSFNKGQTSVKGQMFISEKATNELVKDGKLVVDTDGAWKMTFKRVNSETFDLGTISGTGNTVTSVFVPDKTEYYVRVYHSSSNIFAYAYQYSPDTSYKRTVYLPGGTNGSGYEKGIRDFQKGKQYFIYVETDGEWTIEWDPAVDETTTVDAAGLTYSGYGKEIITDFSLPSGAYYTEVSYNGSEDSDMDVYIYYGDAVNKKWMITYCYGGMTKADYFAEKVELFDKKKKVLKDAYIEVCAEGAWTIAFIPIGKKTSTMNMEGYEDIVSGIFYPTKEPYNLTVMNDTGYTLLVVVYTFDDSGLPKEAGKILFDKGESTKAVTFSGQKYFLVVDEAGQNEYWSLDFGTGEPVTSY